MVRSRINPTAAIAVMGILVWLGIVSAAQSVPAVNVAATVLVPLGVEGDGATYARFERWAGTGDWGFSRNESFMLSSGGRKADQSGTLHDSAALSWRPEEERLPMAWTFLSLQTRDPIRRDAAINLPWRDGNWYPTNVSDFGPTLSPAWFSVADASLLWAQGQEIRSGLDLTKAWRNPFQRAWALETASARLESFRANVDRTAIFDGQLVVEIRLEGQVTLNVSEHSMAGLPWDHHVPFLSGRLPGKSSVAFDRSIWVSQEEPFPLLVHDAFDMAGGAAHEILLSRVGKTAGVAPLPWQFKPGRLSGGASSGEPFGSHDTHPTPGDGSQLRFTMAEALRLAEESPRYAALQTWRLANPGHYLVSLAYHEPVGFVRGERFVSWSFVFATPAGQGFQVQVWPDIPSVSEEEHRAYDPATNGPRSTPAFEPTTLAPGFITVAHAEWLWRSFAEGEGITFASRGTPTSPGSIQWGFQLAATGSPTNRVSGDPTLFSTIRLRPAGSTAATPSGEDVTGCVANEYCLTVDARTGTIQRASMIDYHQAPSGTIIRIAGPPGMAPATRTAALLFGITPPEVALVSTSLLMVLLGFLFYPLLKFIATQGLLGIPGYAKLRRDDLLANRVREQLLTLVRTDPGASATDLASRVQGGWSTIVYHLGVLERHGLVSSMVDTRHKRFFPVGEVPVGRRGQIATLRNARTRAIYELISREPGVGQRTLAQRVAISVAGLAWHLRRLEEVGLVGHDRRQGRLEYYAAPEHANLDRPDRVEIV